ncbi:MAG: hypothetical protein ACRBCI_12165 [Cellvibrionaceae bacterium]
MSDNDFVNSKLNFLKKDKQAVFSELAEPLAKMVESGEATNIVKIPSDGNWFKISFDAVQVREDRLVISAERVDDGVHTSGQYRVNFKGTRAAYLRGYYEPRHIRFGWSYLYWDIRAYANHPKDSNTRVYVHGFKASDEIKQMIKAMESRYPVKNILNTYILDNLTRIKLAVKTGKDPQEVERRWSNGMMEHLGYRHVEVIDTGAPKGSWHEVKSHWYKLEKDAVA